MEILVENIFGRRQKQVDEGGSHDEFYGSAFTYNTEKEFANVYQSIGRVSLLYNFWETQKSTFPFCSNHFRFFSVNEKWIWRKKWIHSTSKSPRHKHWVVRFRFFRSFGYVAFPRLIAPFHLDIDYNNLLKDNEEQRLRRAAQTHPAPVFSSIVELLCCTLSFILLVCTLPFSLFFALKVCLFTGFFLWVSTDIS